MANILVTIISEQTIQNVLFIKQLTEIEKINIDKFVFFSSKKMFDRHFGKWVADVCKIDFEKIDVQDNEEDDIVAIKAALATKFQNVEDNYFVNITGGTKLMSTALYQFFNQSKFPNANIYYLPLGKNTYIQIKENENAKPIAITYQLSVAEYMNSYGVKILKSINTPLCTPDFVRNYVDKGYAFKNFFATLRSLDLREKTFFNWSEIAESPGLRNFLRQINFSLQSNEGLSLNEIKFLGFAGEIEELVYHKVREKIPIRDFQILMGVEIDKEGLDRNKPFYLNDNELDIVFIFNNSLYVIECKRDIQTRKNTTPTTNEKKTFNDIVYTLAAVKDNRNGFGLFVNSYLYCHSDNLREGALKNNDFAKILKSRAALHNVTLMDSNNIDNILVKINQ